MPLASTAFDVALPPVPDNASGILPAIRRALALVAASMALMATPAAATGFDPLGTDALLPPRPPVAGEDGRFAPCPPPAADAALGVLDVVDQALCRHPKTFEIWASARNQAALVGVSQATFLPGVSASGTLNRSRSDGENATTRSTAMTLSWLLADFGTRSANLENARQLLVAAASTLDATVQSVFLNALQAYYNTQAARAAVDAAQEAEKASRESLNAAETRYRVGTATPADQLQARTAWSQAVLNRIKAEGTLRTALGTLASAIGRDPGASLRLDAIPDATPDTAFSVDVDALIATARGLRPDLRAAEAQARAARASIDAARAAGLPTLSLGAGPSWQGTRSGGDTLTTHANAIGLTLTVPIFSGYDTTYRVRSAEAKAEVALAQRDSLALQVGLDVWSTYQALQTATQSLRTAADLLASAEESERVALGRYRAGVGTLIDLLNAQSALAAARVQRIQAALDWHVSRATLAKAVGTLDRRLLTSAELTLP
ncbi:TolC family protein [Propionivibrio dicarboxylicus]|uniref:Protein CyaE n=1 Tax=Propionivibrio dicarboxylicus TaxID=83767 RepID=A0A1G7Y857_9RHOO|nr:TolC family protein [Propionivibrio dicarboxylicus]SDG92648.1 type I secretion outer membrane protein, TolC family [Propionivibrio dicarboxylicus]